MTLMGAIRQLHELRSAEDMPIYFKPVIAEVINALLMDAQEVRHGHWVNKGLEPLRCSECGIMVDTYNGIPWACKSFVYCPNCGAKMDEVEDV